MHSDGTVSRAFRLILIGPPASGKGTQGRRLAQELNLPYLSTGALLREHVEQQTEIGRHAQPILARGGYLSDEWIYRLIGEWLQTADDGWVLDGFPRSVSQAEFLESQLSQQARRLDLAVSLAAPLEVLISRIHARVECSRCRWSGHQTESHDGNECPECHHPVESRADDSRENFISRYREYERFTQPLIRYYQERGMLCSCDATSSRDEVTQKLLGRLSQIRCD